MTQHFNGGYQLGLLGLLAGIIGIVGYVPYIRDVLRRNTQPDQASWLIWTLEYSGLFFAQLARGATDSLWLIGLQLVGVSVVFILSLHYGMGRFGRSKQMLVVSVCLVLILWYFTNNADMAIVLLLAVEVSGVVLTIRKVYEHPYGETLTMWWLVGLAGALGIMAVGNGAANILYLYPASIILMSLGVTIAAVMGARMKQSRERLDAIDLQPQ